MKNSYVKIFRKAKCFRHLPAKVKIFEHWEEFVAYYGVKCVICGNLPVVRDKHGFLMRASEDLGAFGRRYDYLFNEIDWKHIKAKFSRGWRIGMRLTPSPLCWQCSNSLYQFMYVRGLPVAEKELEIHWTYWISKRLQKLAHKGWI